MVNIDSGNVLSPIRRQAIALTIGDILPMVNFAFSAILEWMATRCDST